MHIENLVGVLYVKESELNTIISKSFNDNFFGHKIADGVGGVSVQNPFDGFAVIPGTPIYFESKMMKNQIEAFNFKSIEPHQIENLQAVKKCLPKSLCLITLGIYIPRKLFIVLPIDISFITELMQEGKKSILKKELEPIIEKKVFLKINSIDRITDKGKKIKVKRVIKDDLLSINEKVIKEKIWLS
jgi:penicillin-binding protein-related factor A (putative recombinase)